MSQWFRFYESALDDPKVQRLPGDLFKGWINLLCLAKRHNGTLPPHEDIAFALRLSAKDATKLLDALVAGGLLDHDDNGISPHNWSGRQFVSDGGSTERVQKYREKRRASGLPILSDYTRFKPALIERDGERCVYCEVVDKLVVDHMVPIALGGTDAPDNLALACKPCNSGKAGRTPELANMTIRVTTAALALSRYRDTNYVTVSETPSESETDTDTDSVAKATGGEPPKCDPVKALFDDGLKLLTEAGTPEKQARSLIGGWRKAHGDDATRTAIQAAYDHGAIAPVEFIVASLTRAPKAHETWDQRRIREAMEAIQ